HHAVAAVNGRDDVLLGHGPEEAGPAGPGVELGVRREQRQPAANTDVDARALVVQQGAAERPLGALAARDLELLRRQLAAPLRVGLDDPGGLDRADELSLAVEDFDSHRRLLKRCRARGTAHRPASWASISPRCRGSTKKLPAAATVPGALLPRRRAVGGGRNVV